MSRQSKPVSRALDVREADDARTISHALSRFVTPAMTGLLPGAQVVCPPGDTYERAIRPVCERPPPVAT